MSKPNGVPNGHHAKRPNILIILADDLGFSDIGCFGSEIQTPNIDKLATEGLRFTDYHTSSLCSPTRSMIMSGTDCHMAGLGVMREFRAWDPERWNKPGHEGYLNHDVATLPELLRDSGYHTLMSGKWHLGIKPGHLPHERGFDKAWSMLLGGNNHFGWEPVFLDRNPDIAAVARLYAENGEKWMPEPNKTRSQDGFYSSRYYTTKLLQYLSERNDEEKEKPFFAYLAHSAPHWPLQCFPEDRAKYKGRYNDGPDVLRQERLQRLKEMKIIPEDTVPHPVVIAPKPGWTSTQWEEMTDQERRMSAAAMESYAGMVDRIDQEVGRVVGYLKETGEYDNTIIMFFSDNGASGDANEASDTMGPRVLKAIDDYYDNSEENIGNYNSYCWLGPRWAQAATAPHRIFKQYTTEGGIRVPMVIRYPPFMHSKQGGDFCRSFATCMDLMPTFLELAGAKHPNDGTKGPKSKAPYKDKMVYPMRGKSWLSYLTKGQIAGASEEEAIHSTEDQAVGWEMHGRASLRHGKWKIVNMPPDEYGTGEWQLYDLSVDQGEINDLAKKEPKVLEEMLKHWAKYCEETGAIFGDPVDWAGGLKATKDMIGGDPMDDVTAWMKVGIGKRWGDTSRPVKYVPRGN